MGSYLYHLAKKGGATGEISGGYIQAIEQCKAAEQSRKNVAAQVNSCVVLCKYEKSYITE